MLHSDIRSITRCAAVSHGKILAGIWLEESSATPRSRSKRPPEMQVQPLRVSTLTGHFARTGSLPGGQGSEQSKERRRVDPVAAPG